MRGGMGLLLTVIVEDRVAHSDALVADIRAGVIRWGGDELTNNILTFVAEGTAQRIIGASTFHRVSPKQTKITVRTQPV